MDHIQRRDRGLPYISDERVFEEQKKCRRLLHRINTTDPWEFETINSLFGKLLGSSQNLFINPPFYCDYGSHIHVGDNFFANYNCTIIDVATVTIGDNCFLAPNVALYTAGHPVHPACRNTAYEYGAPIVIGNNVWIGGNSVVLPGVTIGNNVVIGAGSVVTKDIENNSVAAGNPCRILRRITEEDRKFYWKDRVFDGESQSDMERIWADSSSEAFPVIG